MTALLGWPLLYIGCGAAAIAGLLIGLGIGRLARNRLRRELDGRANLEREREYALALATERLSSVFGELASRQFESHTETFLKLGARKPGRANGAGEGRPLRARAGNRRPRASDPRRPSAHGVAAPRAR